MANYYYLGRSAFPSLLIWVTLSVMVAGAGVVTMMLGVSKTSQVNAEATRIEDQLQTITHETNGGSLESALKALEKFRQQKGGIGAYENLEKSILNANLERRHARKMKEMVNEGQTDGEVEAWLKGQILPGLNAMLAKEEVMIDLYEGLISGAEPTEEMLDLLKRDGGIPEEIKWMSESSNFSFADGAKALRNALEGQKNNVALEVKDLKEKEETIISQTATAVEERFQLLPKLKEEFVEKSRALDEERVKNIDVQSEGWMNFLDETKRVVDKWRQVDIEVFEKEQALKQKAGLLVTKVEGQDYIPPLDLIDAKIISVDYETNRVIIDLGRRHGLKRGQGFDVFKVKGDALQYKKGRIEVINVDAELAVCHILESLPLEPMAMNDVVANGPADNPFDRKISSVYVLSGQFLKSLSKDLVRYMIKSSGGTIRDQISKSVTCVVIGDQPNEEDLKLCRQLGVRTVRVRDLARFLDYSPNEVAQLKRQNWK